MVRTFLDKPELSSFQAVILPSNQYVTLEPRTEFILGNGYTLYVSSEMPELDVKEVRFPVDYKVPYQQNMKFQDPNISSIPPDVNESILRLKSRLNFAVRKFNRLYWKLVNKANETNTYRLYEFVLFYDQFVCSAGSDFFDLLNVPDYGISLLSTKSLSGLSRPKWFIRECFRDVWNLEFIYKYNNIKVVDDEEDIYLFTTIPYSLGQIEEFSENMISHIQGFIDMRRFPINTPFSYIQSRRLNKLPNGQFECSIHLENSLDILPQFLNAVYSMNSLRELYWMLLLLSYLPTYPFIQRNIRIFIKENSIILSIMTEYLPDFVRVNIISRVIGRELSGNVYITESEGIELYDSESEKKIYLNCPEYPRLLRSPEYKGGYTLSDRIQVDDYDNSHSEIEMPFEYKKLLKPSNNTLL